MLPGPEAGPEADAGDATLRTVVVAEAGPEPIALVGTEGVAPLGVPVPAVAGLWLGPPWPGAGGRFVLMDSGDGEGPGTPGAPGAPGAPPWTGGCC